MARPLLRRLKIPLRIAVAALLLWLVVRKIPLDDVAQSLEHVSWRLFALGTALFLPTFLLQALRWRALFAGGRDSVPGVWAFFRLICIGQFASLFLPSSAGGDVVRAVLLGRDEKAYGAAAGSILLGRVVGVAALVAFVWIGRAVEPAHLGALPRAVPAMAVLTAGLALCCAFLAFAPDAWLAKALDRPKLAGLLANVRGARALPAREKAAVVALSVAIQFLSNLLTAVLYWAVGMPFPAIGLFTLLPLLMLVNMVPVSFFNIGVREAAMIALFTPLPGITAAQCVAASALGYVSVLFPSAVGALFWACRAKKGEGEGR
ncbi:MAG: flippase-like domain-containing protein [Fibrobacterales bacterium]|nr:flippase-like domain-containing protein [Fibrobacterales bacterium]